MAFTTITASTAITIRTTEFDNAIDTGEGVAVMPGLSGAGAS